MLVQCEIFLSVSINISNTAPIFLKSCTIAVLQRNSPDPVATCHFPRNYPTDILKYKEENYAAKFLNKSYLINIVMLNDI
jgi:hypothetical protein